MPTALEVYYADTVLVAPYYVWGLLSRVDQGPTWAPDMVQCCVVENGAHPTAVGCAIRTLLRCAPYEGTVLREVLEGVQADGPHEWSFSLRFQHSDRDAVSPMTHQSLISSLVTTWRVSCIPTDVNKSFVSVKAAYVIETVGDVEHREADAEAVAEVTQFLSWWVTGLHRSMSDYVISVAYPLKEGRLTVERRKEYERFEDAVVGLAARSDIPPAVASTVEALLQSWVRETRNSDEKDILIHHFRQEVASARRIAEAAALAAATSVDPSPETPPQTAAQQCVAPSEEKPVECEPAARSIPTPPTVNAVLQQLGVKDSASHASPYAPEPLKFDPIAISRVVEKGKLNEVAARRAFDQLDAGRKGWLTAEEVTQVLMTVERFGVYEDIDGTLERLATAREVASKPLATLSEEQAASSDAAVCLTPREKEKKREEARVANAARAMKQQAERWMTRYARLQKGRLHYDEFCLLLLQLSLQ